MRTLTSGVREPEITGKPKMPKVWTEDEVTDAIMIEKALADEVAYNEQMEWHAEAQKLRWLEISRICQDLRDSAVIGDKMLLLCEYHTEERSAGKVPQEDWDDGECGCYLAQDYDDVVRWFADSIDRGDEFLLTVPIESEEGFVRDLIKWIPWVRTLLPEKWLEKITP